MFTTEEKREIARLKQFDFLHTKLDIIFYALFAIAVILLFILLRMLTP